MAFIPPSGRERGRGGPVDEILRLRCCGVYPDRTSGLRKTEERIRLHTLPNQLFQFFQPLPCLGRYKDRRHAFILFQQCRFWNFLQRVDLVKDIDRWTVDDF